LLGDVVMSPLKQSSVSGRASVLLALLICALSAGARAEDGASCQLAVRIEGPTEDVAPIAEELRRRGIDDAPVWRCAAMRVRVHREAGAWVVDIAHAGELLRRSLVAPEAAGAFIASWLHADPGPAPLPLSSAPELNASERWARAAAGAFDIDATFDGVGAEDTGYGVGLTVAGCAPLGRFCAGALAHFAEILTTTDINESIHLLGGDVWSTDVLLLGEMPLRSTHWQFSPYLAFGGGFLHGSTNALGPRLEGGFSASLSVSAHFAFACRLSAMWSPGAAEEPLVGRLGLGVRWSGP
jgi:hypothetical protein